MLVCLMLLAGAAHAERLPDEFLVTYFNNSVFVGDSLPRMFRNYVVNTVQKAHPDYFASTKFYTAYNYQLFTATQKQPPSSRTNLSYRGYDVSLCQLMERLQPEKLFILAGLNDNICDHSDRGMRYVAKIVELMEKYAPDTQVHFFSLTPVTAAVAKKRPNVQEKLDAYNALLEQKCQEVGAIYIDIATALKGEDGLMKVGISSDGEYHLDDEGNAIWLQTLLDFVQAQYESGNWVPVLPEP